MNHAPHLYFAWQQLVEKSQLMLRLATEEQWDELIASEMAYVNAVQELPAREGRGRHPRCQQCGVLCSGLSKSVARETFSA